MSICDDNRREEKKKRALIKFYTGVICSDGKLDVYEYMRCYSYIRGLSENDMRTHFKALNSVRENFEKNISSAKVKKLEK